jgi:hypothetical protein
MSEPTRKDHVFTYGHWAWIIGLSFAIGLTVFMFLVADGFS